MAYIRITDEELHSLPDDQEAAFVAFEKILREKLEDAIANVEGVDSDFLTLDYMNGIITAARLYGIMEISGWQRTAPGKHNWGEYSRFVAEVDSCTLAIRMRRVRNFREHSVSLQAATKKKLSHMLAQMREAVENIDIPVEKKDRLRSRINALQEEIDRERTHFQAFGALVVEACADLGEAGKRLDPIVQIIERIGTALGLAKRAERAQIPPPPKRLGGPKSSKNLESQPSSQDDIPF